MIIKTASEGQHADHSLSRLADMDQSYVAWLLPHARSRCAAATSRIRQLRCVTAVQRESLKVLWIRAATEDLAYHACYLRVSRLLLLGVSIAGACCVPLLLLPIVLLNHGLSRANIVAFLVGYMAAVSCLWFLAGGRWQVWVIGAALILPFPVTGALLVSGHTLGIPLVVACLAFSGPFYSLLISEDILRRLQRYAAWPSVSRRTRCLLEPHKRIAAKLTEILCDLESIGSPWRIERSRAAADRILARAASSIERDVVYRVWAAGGNRTARKHASRLGLNCSAMIDAFRLRLAGLNDRAAYSILCAEILQAALACATGDLSGILQNPEPMKQRTLGRLLRKSLAPLSLVAAALLLPVLPGVNGAALASMQGVLILAAVLSLVEPGDPAKDTILQAYRDASR